MFFYPSPVSLLKAQWFEVACVESWCSLHEFACLGALFEVCDYVGSLAAVYFETHIPYIGLFINKI